MFPRCPQIPGWGRINCWGLDAGLSGSVAAQCVKGFIEACMGHVRETVLFSDDPRHLKKT